MDNRELIDLDKLDLTNQEYIEAIRFYLKRMLNDVRESMTKSEAEINGALGGFNDVLDKTDVGKMERIKTILSKVLYVIGSAISPETMPVEMFDKQKMPEDKKRGFNDVRGVARDNIRYFNEKYAALKKYEELHESFKKDILSSDEKVINYFRALNEAYNENIVAKVPTNMLDGVLYINSLYYGKYINMEQIRELGGCLFFKDAHMTREFEEFNSFFIRKYGNGKKE